MMRNRRVVLAALAAAALGIAAGVAPAAPQASPGKGAWSARGTLLESCTCAVPCTCNFGEGPSPNHYCHAVFAYRLEKGQWDGVDLSGLVVGGADGPDGEVGFVDARATPEQRAALEKIGMAIFRQGGPVGRPRRFLAVPITHESKGRDLSLKLGTHGGFTAKVILGRDGRNPVVVENNTTWPIKRAIKGKASVLTLAESAGAGTINASGVNANFGEFDMSGKTAGTPARPVAAIASAGSAAPSTCCTPKR